MRTLVFHAPRLPVVWGHSTAPEANEMPTILPCLLELFLQLGDFLLQIT